MKEPGYLIFGFISTSIILIYVIIKIRSLYIGEDKINKEIIEYYENKELTVINISKLNLIERMKYGVPIISIFRIYSYYFGLLSGKIDYVRKIELIDKKENEYTKYVELFVQGKEIISFREFASCEI
jgi:hypothetical protein